SWTQCPDDHKLHRPGEGYASSSIILRNSTDSRVTFKSTAPTFISASAAWDVGDTNQCSWIREMNGSLPELITRLSIRRMSYVLPMMTSGSPAEGILSQCHATA